MDFIPYEIWFDVQGLPGRQDGTFGVFCQYQDADNHYYAEFDLQSNSYIIAQYLDGEDIPLTKQNNVGQFWYETDAFNSSPTAVNRIGVSCYLDSITLFINDQGAARKAREVAWLLAHLRPDDLEAKLQLVKDSVLIK